METTVAENLFVASGTALLTTTRQIATRFADASRRRLVTELVERPLRALRPGEVLVEMIAVPIHGSFWLATHPDGLHPRKEAFLGTGGFVFGNGGVGRVLAVADGASARTGDVVAIFGHVPCSYTDCHSCGVEHRYTECRYGESAILGHGGALDGTYSQYVILPPHSYEIACHTEEALDERTVCSLAYAFLIADVRNALTRNPDTLRRDRILLFGAGQSGRVAAYLLLRAMPGARIVVVDACAARAAQLRTLQPEAIDTYVPPASVVSALNDPTGPPITRDGLAATIGEIACAIDRRFDGARSNLVFDASSGNTAPLWTNPRVLSPGSEVMQFGFGSRQVQLDRDVIQISGLTIRTSRGVGTIANRREVLDLVRSDDTRFVDRFLIAGSHRLEGLDEAMAFVRAQHDPPSMLHRIPQAYIAMAPASDRQPD